MNPSESHVSSIFDNMRRDSEQLLDANIAEAEMQTASSVEL